MAIEAPGWRLFGKWVASTTCGAVFGLTTTAGFALGALAALGPPTTTLGRLFALLFMTLCGALEGLSLGYFQWRVLRQVCSEVPPRTWILASTAVAAGGWFLGMLVPLFAHVARDSSVTNNEPRPPVALAAYLFFWALVGGSMGVAFGSVQSLALPRRGDVRAKWIRANAVGWGFGLPCAYLAGPLGPGATGPTSRLLFTVGGGLCLTLSVSIATGLSLIGLKRSLVSGLPSNRKRREEPLGQSHPVHARPQVR